MNPHLSSVCSFSLLLAGSLQAQQPAAAPSPVKGLQWQLGDAAVKLGGYVKVDLIHDFDAIGSTDTFDPRTIPTDGSDGSNTRMHARQSRLNLDVSRPSSGTPMHFFVEGDFFGDGSSFRLRHAYGEIAGVLAGQTWTSFMDEAGMPETLDFESPIGFPQIRQSQIRYTKKLESGDSCAFSVEEPASKIIPPTGVPGKQEEVLPDLTANYIWRNPRGHVQVSGFGGMAAFQPDTGSDDTVALWGVNVSTKLTTTGKDNAILQLTYGDGVGRYRGGTTAAPDANGDLEAITTTGVMGAYQHFWSEEYRSTVTYSWVEGDLPAGTPPTSPESLQYFAVNVIYQFTEHAWTGIEYLYGTNDAFDDTDGDASRVQISVRYDL
jgi:outer membrane DcaP-like protein